ncbi:MAG: hypothetical protein OQJ76_06770 [Rhodospirillales bacterium]|nr:hypothetical protein [Rhodospirillales bacterium]MCW9040183.1 hypothetical protein [Rhodospirillales bacterium]
MAENERFAVLRGGRRTWAVAAIHGEAARLSALHAELGERFRPGDNIVYLGNFLGRGDAVADTIDELLSFRTQTLASGGEDPGVVAFLRGSQEEMWQKLLTIQFAPNPNEVLTWMSAHGIGPTLAAYGGSIDEGFKAAREGIMSLTQWTNGLRSAMRNRDGHNALISALRRAAYTDDNGLLFVSAGLDPERPLSEQSDSFWWGGADFAAIDKPYENFRRIIRGYDPRHRGVVDTGHTATIDGGCGFGGSLIAACFTAEGTMAETIEA